MLRRTFALAMAMTVLVVACGDDEAESSGTLEVIVDGEGAGFGDFTTGGDKSFGLFICAGGGPVTLESIEPTNVEGDVEFLGAMVYTTPDEFLGAADGFPSDGTDAGLLEQLEGAVVEVSCVDPEGEERQQILVGVERTGLGGGRVDGFVVGTSGGDVEVTYAMLMCGDELEYCEVLDSAGDT